MVINALLFIRNRFLFRLEHPHGEGILLPGCDHGLGEPDGALLEAVQHAGQRVLFGRPGRSDHPIRLPRDLQHGQGVQFTAEAFTESLRSRNIAISMDGKGRWMDIVFIERLWKSVKFEDIYRRPMVPWRSSRKGLGAHFTFYNEKRWHQTFDRKTPSMVYFSTLPQKQAAA